MLKGSVVLLKNHSNYMAKSKETFNKKQKETKRLQKRQQKESRKQERESSKQKGLPLSEMMAYIDENGNLTNTPPEHGALRHLKRPVNVRNNNVSTEESRHLRTGVVTFFNEAKGFGFIQDLASKERVFMHVSDLVDKVKEQATVHFEVERGERGLSARKIRLSDK